MKHLIVLLKRSGFGLLNFLALLAFCALAAKWTWVFLAPAPVAVLEQSDSAVMQGAATIIASHLLTGKMVLNQAPADIKLQGVFAAKNDAQGYAIFQTGGDSVMVPINGQVIPGTTLEAIYKDHVLLNRDGAKMRVELEQDAPPLNLEAHSQ